MALPIRPTKMISLIDTAIDLSTDKGAAAHTEYYLRRKWDVIEPFILFTQKPQIFHVRLIPQKLMGYVNPLDTENPYQRGLRSLQCALERIENLHQEDGTLLHEWPAVRDGDGKIPRDELEGRLSGAEIYEIGEVCRMASFLPRRIEPTYLLSPTWHELLHATVRHRVEQSLRALLQSSGEASSGTAGAKPQPSGTASAPSTPGESGAAPTAATAATTAGIAP